ncbi:MULTISPECIES: IS3 family transposase [Thomasclavelia]|uniref:IS3 family transposase n=1 Tax=Thomasclavelia TaxID=3025755 RepID=UPI0009DE8865|nr:IS3 family transposase [Erysipelatoclostridium sp. MSK.7.34]MBU9878059.1 IS3 family transposase [Thomasclavelia ramosa]MBV3166329.1 IS3 family transposase [Erysipelatoclostridium sp. MSK.23.68]MBV3180794.1 IS3 family transposase [Erysipelatoclostridium sp. MSK.23.67]MBV3247441.1 IS3 family transposase [Erysipelatoclostridium sp. MSK.23.31]
MKRKCLNGQKICDYNHVSRLVFEYINSFYNTLRIHEHCDYQSPLNYEKEFNEILKN